MVSRIKTNVFYTGDNVKLMKTMPLDCVDMVCTSPPYGAIREYKGYSFNYKETIYQLSRVLKSGGIVVWIVGDETVDGSESGESFKQALWFMKMGFYLHDTMIYLKDGFRFPETVRYHQVFEYMFVFSKDKPKTFNPIKDRRCAYAGSLAAARNHRNKDGTLTGNSAYKKQNNKRRSDYGTRYNVWEYSTGGCHSSQDKIAFDHPAIFPEQLAHDHIVSWSNHGDLVLDPFVGSGTVAKMAWLSGRQFIGMDVSKEYIDGICVPRLKMCGWPKAPHQPPKDLCRSKKVEKDYPLKIFR